ncbi:dihydroxyacetone kinase subunit DhaL [Brachybacterium hainanense]|uniref:Dihydroxyacetone kinase subunit DhaL n=1 Tax=Brachybacterium hainanense TaxID=1541174 RepID=A0ABV6RBT7_9MICO
MTHPTSQNLTLAELGTWLRRASTLLAEASGHLNELDAAIGDADHGSNMRRGFAAVEAALDAGEFPDVAALMKKVGMTLVSSVGGASGPLYGTFFLRLGTSQAGETELGADALLAALEAGVEGIAQRGRAVAGEKTMLDAWLPALEAYREELDDLESPASPAEGTDALVTGRRALAAAVDAGARAAAEGRDATEPLQASKGRASYLGERSIGHIDPGAASTAILWQALREVLA